MRFTRGMSILIPALFAALVLVAGCRDGQAPTPPGKAKGGEAKQKHDDHSGWWCPEHGLPEEICDLCDRKYAAAEKAKGNWCEHDRVKTSCFKCNPGLKAKWAKEYEARFGEPPPKTEDDEVAEKEKGEK